MADTIEHYFRPITHTFLDKEWGEGFTVYYKSKDGNKVNFLNFAQYTPDDYARLERIMKEADRQEFYIHENDLIRYYRQCVLKRVRESIEKEAPPLRERVNRIYPVMRRILSDYLDFDTSTRMLRALDEIPDLLVPHLEGTLIPFPTLVSLTSKDASFETHCANVGLYALYLGRVLNLNGKDLRALLLGGLLSDIGKKGFPPELAEKNSDLAAEDMKAIRRHPSSGRKLLNDMKCYPEEVLRMVGEHHENFDGSGYPFGLAGDKISLFARIGRIMDVFNAMTCRRPYREQLKPVAALGQIKSQMDGHFDPDLIALLFKSFTT